MPTMVKVRCAACNKEFEIELKRYNEKNKNTGIFYCSLECNAHRSSKLCKCATCGKEIWKTNSQIARSKTGNVYCSRSCANSKNNTLFKSGVNNPNYSGKNYRSKAFETYPHRCLACGWDEDERILEVHHKDENHENNDINNLCLLCPTCHRKITLHYYVLIYNKLLPV